MKKSLVSSVLGLAMVGPTVAYGQGTIVFGNYASPYNSAMTWENGTPVRSTDGVNLALWCGQGTDASALVSSVPVAWNSVAESNGYYGYIDNVQVSLAAWQPGQNWVFQFRATGTAWYNFPLITDASSLIVSTTGTPPPLPKFYFVSLAIPEPAPLTLAALGAGGLMLFRRRD